MGVSSVSLCHVPAPHAELGNCDKAVDLLLYTKNSRALAVSPPVLDILFSQSFFPCSLFRSLHPAELVLCVATCILFLILGPLFTRATSSAQHSTAVPSMDYHWCIESSYSLLFFHFKLIFLIYHPAFPPQFFHFQILDTSTSSPSNVGKLFSVILNPTLKSVLSLML